MSLTTEGMLTSTLDKAHRIPPPPKLSELEEDIRSVLALDVPQKSTKKFPGLEKIKIDKKDRHVAAVDDFGKLLENFSGKLEKEVLDLSREIRENLEVIDNELQVYYKQLENDEFLTARSEDQLILILEDLKGVLCKRDKAIEQFANNLEGVETNRANTIGSELKKYTDKLIGIAHQLADEIEHIIETETFELNSVLTKNRQAYALLLGLINKRNVEVEVETLQRWEDSREHWRKLRHDKGIADFLIDINSERFRDPPNRQAFMTSVRDEQAARQEERMALLRDLGKLTAENINSDDVVKIQHEFGIIHETGMESIQSCYNGLSELRVALQNDAKVRVEELRKELHEYGALKKEPELRRISTIFQAALENPAMTELWRLGGGLKTEFQTLMNDMRSINIVYDNHMNSIQSRLEVIVSGFDLKAILEERGRLVQLDKVRNLLIKMRNVAREDVPDVLVNLLPELEENLEIEKIPEVFRKEVGECVADMKAELQKVNDFNSPGSAETATNKSSTKTSKKTGTLATNKNSNIDPISVRHWNRRLGILYYGSDMLSEYQEACIEGLDGAIQQRGCNNLIDEVVRDVCDKKLINIEKAYKKLTDNVANYLEAQVSCLCTNLSNVGSFYLVLAKIMEKHRKLQHELDERAMDELFDKKEDFRLEREDREAEFEEACQTLRKSTDHAELAQNFEAVLGILAIIQDSYRRYHEKACFLADKHPLALINEFRSHLVNVCSRFDMSPLVPHFILDCFDRLHDKIKRFNKNLIEEDPELLDTLPDYNIVLPGPPQSVDNANAKKAAKSKKAAAGKGADIGGFESLYVSPTEEVYLEAVRLAEDPGYAHDSAVVKSPAATVASTASVAGGASVKSGVSGSASATGKDDKSVAFASDTADGDIDLPRGGRYGLIKTEDALIAHLNLDSTLVEYEEELLREEAAAAAAASAVTTAPNTAVPDGRTEILGVDGAEGEVPVAVEAEPGSPAEELPPLDADDVDVETEIPKIPVHEEMPWLTLSTIYKSPDELSELDDPDDVFAYNKAVIKGLIEMDEEVKEALTEEQQAAYAAFLQLKQETEDRVAREADPEFIRANVPKDLNNSNWVLEVCIPQDFLRELIMTLKNSLVTSLELEMQRRISIAEELCRSRIDELTEEFEDRLRTHWPRRGRVETQIKQPREAELLSHEEKTWRLLQDIQHHMIDIQGRFHKQIKSAKEACDAYINDVNVLKNSLSSTSFKTLAALQGVDVRARSTTISFQQACASNITLLNRMVNDEPTSVVTFAQDFRKICPPQEPGKEGGYSESEIDEIQRLVDDQCAEIRVKIEEWNEEIVAIKEQQNQSVLCQDEFTKKYEKCTQDLAMSEGLGQKYGAPRRRAQERIRTEVSRDEQSAGFVDELLANLEFICSEKQRLMDEAGEDGAVVEEEDEDAPATVTVSPSKAKDKDKKPGMPSSKVGNGLKEFELTQEIWRLLVQLRAVLTQRLEYLEIVGNKRIELVNLPWLPMDRINMLIGDKQQEELPFSPTAQAMTVASAGGGPVPGLALPDPEEDEEAVSDDNGGVPPVLPRFLRADAMNLRSVVQDVDALCRKETRELYISEDKIEILGDEPNGVPESLRVWLGEAHDKILGKDGHRERSWKRIWGQVDRLETVLCRKPLSIVHLNAAAAAGGAITGPVKIPIGIPGVCMRYLATSFILYARQEQTTRVDGFMKSVRVWIKGRDKHERLLRPRLGSPDAVEELNSLDAIEMQRSQEMISGVTRFRNDLLKRLIALTMQYIGDIAVSSKGLLSYIDTSLTQDIIQVPPDTAIPKVRLTLKRLRKAERVKSSIAAGQEDNTQYRVWPAVNLEQFSDLSTKICKLMVASDGENSSDPQNMIESDELLTQTEEWANNIREETTVRAMVSTAHRALVNERNRSITQYLSALDDVVLELSEKFAMLLKQECSWSERWQRQVGMLRNGNI